jgi:hypothetical protein
MTRQTLAASKSRRRNPDRETQELFDWTSTEIELFYIRYLQVRRLSSVRHMTNGMCRSVCNARGIFGAPRVGWEDRPGSDNHFPATIWGDHDSEGRFSSLRPKRWTQIRLWQL